MMNHLQNYFHSHSLYPIHQPIPKHILLFFLKYTPDLVPTCQCSLLLEEMSLSNTPCQQMDFLIVLIVHIPLEIYSTRYS